MPTMMADDAKDSDGDDVDWEDTETAEAEPMRAEHEHDKKQQHEPKSGVPRAHSTSTSEESDFPRQLSASTAESEFTRQQSGSTADNEEDDGDPFVDVDIHGGGDFGSRHVEVDNEAALQQAEATAANLTNWAGRAVRRAIAAHKAEQGEPEVETQQMEPSQQKEQAESPVLAETDEAKETVDFVPGTEPVVLEINEENAEETAQLLRDYETEITDAAKKNDREMDGPTDEMQEEIKQLLQLFGVPWVQAPAEAEAQCVELEKLGLVSGVVTEDSDVFVFGGKKVYKNIFDDQKYVEIYHSVDAERELGINYNGMVALAMLLGGDYTEGVKGVGIVNSMEVVRDFEVAGDLKGGLQRFRAWLDGFEPVIDANARKEKGKSLTKEQRFHNDHRTLRNKWIAPENFPSDSVINAYKFPVVDNSRDKFSFGTPDMDGILGFLAKHAGWVPEETKRILAPVVERVEGKKSYQPRIDQYMTYERGIKFADVRSKRLRKVFESVRNGGTVEDEKDEVVYVEGRTVARPKPKRPGRRSRLSATLAEKESGRGVQRQTSQARTTLPAGLQATSTHPVVDVNLPDANTVADTSGLFEEPDPSLAKPKKAPIANPQPKKKPTALSTYLGQKQSSDEKQTEREHAEAVRQQRVQAVRQQQKRTLPSRPPPAYSAKSTIPARAPPAYSETSNRAGGSSAKEGAESSGTTAGERPNFPSMPMDSDDPGPSERPSFPSMPMDSEDPSERPSFPSMPLD